ncbi:MAG: MFS transporter [Candidatus Bathyarchaeia archaeon]
MEKPLWIICITHMFIEVYLLMQVALIPVIIREFQLSLLEASLIATIPSILTLLMNLPSGLLTDKFTTNQLLSASMLIEGLSTFLVSQTNNFWTLIVGVSLLKISSPIYHISGLSQLSRLAKPEKISRYVGFHNALGSLGSVAGLITLAVFLTTFSWRITYLFWAAPILLWGFIILKSPYLRTKPAKRESYEKKNHRFTRLSLIFSAEFIILLLVIGVREIGATGSSTFMTTFFTDTRGLPDATASLIFSLGPFAGIAGSLIGGYLGERLGAKKALSLTILCSAFSLILLPVAFEPYLIVLAYLLYSFFSSAIWSPMNTIVANVTPETERGMSYSVYFLTEGLLASVAPTLAAGFIVLTEIWFVFPYSVVFMIVSVFILQFLKLPQHQRNNFKQSTE